MEGKVNKVEFRKNATNFRSTRTRGVVFGEEIMVVNVGKGREENAGTAQLRSNEISLILEWSHDGSTNYCCVPSALHRFIEDLR